VTSPQTLSLLALAMLKGVGPAALKRVAAIERFWEQDIAELCSAVPQLARALESEATAAWAKAKEAADRQLEAAERHSARILSPLDADYPRLLADTKDDPFLLFVQGVLAKDQEKSVAVIGTREPTLTGQVIAQRIARAFVEQGWSIVSGLAIGCDAIAHRTALEAKGHTVAVLAHGLQMIAPSRHKGLAAEILDSGGALVSEYLFGQGVQSQQFVKRDRTQAGMAQGVVMIQSDIKGGSLHASRAALDYKRWLAVPYPTPRDVQHGEPKVQGNLVIADGTNEERAMLLRCPATALDRVYILRGREDILRLAGAPDDLPGTIPEPGLNYIAAEKGDIRDDDVPPVLGPTATPVVAELPLDLNEDANSEEHKPLPAPAAQGGHAEEASPPPTEGPQASSQEVSSVTADRNAPEEPHKDQSPPPRITFKRGARYHVAVQWAPYSDDLSITQVPAWRLGEYRTRARATPRDVDLVFVLASRLEHLQRRLDEVNRFRSSMAQALDEARLLPLQFLVEEVLMHMKRSVDELTRLDFAKDVRAVVDLPVIVDHSQMSLIEPKQVSDYVQVDLGVTLDQIVKSLPLSAVVFSGSHKTTKTARRKDAIDIALDDLVHSFNGLVSRALGDDMTAQSDSRRSHASQLD
jgi:DNA protecting protein DprA